MAQNLGKLLGGDAKKRRALTELRQMTRDDSDVRLIAEILARDALDYSLFGAGSIERYGGRNLSITNAMRRRWTNGRRLRLLSGCFWTLMGK